MHKNFEKFDLQFFAEDVPGEIIDVETSAGVVPADAGQGTGVSAADAGQSRQGTKRSLEEMGVPKEMAERYRARKAKSAAPAAAVTTAAAEVKKDDVQQGAAAVEAKAQTEQKKPTWDELMKDPEYKQKLGEIVRERVKNMQGQLEAIAPSLELMARRAGMDVTDLSKLDYAALNKAIVDDDSLYEANALAEGIEVDAYKRSIQREMDYNSRVRALNTREQDFKATLEQMVAQNYQSKINADAAELKKEFPDFDLEKELKNPRFKAMVSPGGGFTLADAYYAVHRAEIRAAIETQTAQRVQQAMARSMQSGRQMPVENGSRSKSGAPVGNKLYSQMSAEERKAYKAELQRRSNSR